jgi:CHAT domain-containing protein
MEFRGGGDDDMGIPQVRSLENAGAEVEKIAGLFKQQQQQRDQVVLTGLEATRKRVFTEIQQAGYLHFATHGYSVVFGRGADNRQRAAAVAAFAPMAMCGLTLSGSNNTGKNGFVGVITAEEIAGLDLSGCQLAVLSACSTYLGGEGQGRAGHGFASLQGALHAAGVRWVITTRWDVNDAAAMKLMERFYTELWKNPGIHPRTALDRAQEQMRKDRPVNDWAGFILTGDLKD